MKTLSNVFGIIALIAVIGFVFTACENPSSGGRPKNYTVTFDANGGSEAASQTVKDGGTIAELPTSTRGGYAFIGWFTDKDVWNNEFTSSTVVNGNLKVYARWEALPSNAYSISYYLDGGTNDSANPSSYTEETETIALNAPSKPGFTFEGWFDNAEFNGNAITSITKGSTGNKTFYAKWTKLPPGTYSITYNLNGGSNDAGNPLTYTKESAAITLKAPSRTGFTFGGWFDNADLSGSSVSAIPNGSEGNKILYAKWTAIQYTITYYLNDGNHSGNPSTYTIETDTITLQNPARDYYDFIGWFDNAGFNGNAVTSIPEGSTGDKNLYAKWTLTNYGITYNLNGGTNHLENPASYTIETETITLNTPTKDFYAFSGWFDNAGFNGSAIIAIPEGSTGSKTFYAKWTIDLISPVAYTDLSAFLSAVKDNEIDNSAAAPIMVKLSPINISDVWGEINNAVKNGPNYIILDLSDCTATGNTIAGDQISPTGNDMNIIEDNIYMKGIILPSTLRSIGTFSFYECPNLSSIIIPDSVTSIGSSVFYQCISLVRVRIPGTVTSMGSASFRGCTSLAEIIIDSANTKFTSEDGILFNIEKTSLIQYPAAKSGTNYTIPNSVTTINDYAFQENANLTSVIIPSSVTSIGTDAFYKCASLTELTIPGSVASIERGAFRYCPNLTNVTIENGVSSIVNTAFSYCPNLESVTIPDSVTIIDGWAFQNCTSLDNVIIPNSVTSIGNEAFANCTDLANVSIGSSVETIGTAAFDSTGLTSVIIPNSVTSIGDDAFANCTDLANVSIGSSVETIGAYAFDSTGLTSVIIPDSVTLIGNRAFSGCTNLAAISIGSSVETIGTAAFDNCTSLDNVIIPESVESIGNSAFYKCTSLTNITIGSNVTSIGSGVFMYCENLPSITIPNSITSIASQTFMYCPKLSEIIIGANLSIASENSFPTGFKAVYDNGGKAAGTYKKSGSSTWAKQ